MEEDLRIAFFLLMKSHFMNYWRLMFAVVRINGSLKYSAHMKTSDVYKVFCVICLQALVFDHYFGGII